MFPPRASSPHSSWFPPTHRLFRRLLRTPLRGALLRAHEASARLSDWSLNIETLHRTVEPPAREALAAVEPGRAALQPRYPDMVHYRSIHHRNIRWSLDRLDLGPDDVFVDLGCGMGRVLCMAARRSVRRVIGIELLASLCHVAQENVERVRGRRSPVEVICADACTVDLSMGTAFYLFNPFGAETMRDVLANLRRSLEARPRPIRICYVNPVQDQVFEACSWLARSGTFLTWGGTRVTFWHSGMERPLGRRCP